ncbi:unnamed protein product [Urochloa decumbens]|uniref:Uncharacterized protein n=1 Tax=Urochloa decumbens TaxID=240449 RepID=A0ABC9APB6_9POAL
MEEQFAVTAATGALGPVLAKLTALLGDEYKLQEGTRQDIVSIKSGLEPVHDLLGKLWGREDLDVACKDLLTAARELSYDMEDNLDRFITLGLERGETTFIQRETLDIPFKEFMESVKGVSERCREVQMTGEAIICKRHKLTTDPRARFLHKDASELVGMEENKKELIKLLQEHKMVCIFGVAGMGKTTLAELVYHTIGDQFQCRAFVSVNPSPNMMEILSTIRSQVTNGASTAGSVTEPADQENIIDNISLSLSDKRYLAIIDDIWHWEEWEVIRKALPNNNLGCKIIMTTRIKTIAEKCQTEQGTHVYRQSFSYEDAERLSHMTLTKCVQEDILEANAKGLSAQIAYTCGTAARGSSSCPLAVICLSSAWAQTHVQRDYLEWDTWDDWVSKVLLDRFLSTASLKPLVQSLSLGFDDLPVDLKTCLLYCSMYPWDYHRIERDCLVTKWIVEGFVWQEEVAQASFDKLVSRDLLQPVLENKYRVHPMMLAFLVCKAKEDNLVACMRYNSSSHAKQMIRRLSFYCMDRYPHEDVSHTRSLAFHGYHPQLDDVSFNKFKNLRVLEFDSCGGLENRHLVDICGMFGLRHLVLNQQITELPREIGRLQNLETLAVKSSSISKLPREIEKLQNLKSLNISDTSITELQREVVKLQHLETLNISNTKVTELAKEIGKLQHLKTLNISNTKVMELPREIGELQHLETLNISSTNVRELQREVVKLQHLETLNISNTKVTELAKEIWKLQHLKTLNVSNTKVMELPREIGELQHLETLNISNTNVSELPREIGKLQHLRTINIRMIKVRELYLEWEVPHSLTVIFGSMDTALEQKVRLGVSPAWKNSIISSSGAKCREDISTVVLIKYFHKRCEVVNIPMHRLAGRHMNVPEWVKQDLSYVSSLDIRLWKLGEDDHEFLKQMPNLQALQLKFEVLPREPIAITGGGFSKLETFYVDCRLPRAITFSRGAMPMLRHLEFKFYTGTTRQHNSMGITHLRSLEKMVFRCSEYYTGDSPGISATIDVVRKEAAAHPNEITLWVNDMKPEVFGGSAKWISQADRAIIQKETEERERMHKQRMRLYRAAEKRAERDKQEQRKSENSLLSSVPVVGYGTVDRARLEEIEEPN